MGFQPLVQDDGDMEFIESLAGQLAAAVYGVVAASPALLIGAAVVVLVLVSGLAARALELVEDRSMRLERARHVAAHGRRAIASAARSSRVSSWSGSTRPVHARNSSNAIPLA